MPPKTAAERMAMYRMRMSEEKRTELKKRNAEQQKKSRSKWNNKRLKKEKEESKRRMRCSRLKRKLPVPTSASKEPFEGISSSKAFSSVQSLGSS